MLVVVAAAGCMALAWWQWTRFESATGTFQNLGYALQWPAFAAFCMYGYYKFVRLEDAPPEPIHNDVTTEIPAGLCPKGQSPQHNPMTIPRCGSTTPTLPTWPRKTRNRDRNTRSTCPRRVRPQGPDRIPPLGVDHRPVADPALLRDGRQVVYDVEGLNWIAVVHGWVYFVYLLFTANLAVKVRWPIAKTIGVLLAGTIPLVGIIVEHFQTRDVKAKFGI